MAHDAFENPLGWNTTPQARPNVELFDKTQKELHALCIAFKLTFETEAGKKVLEFMRAATIESAAWMPSIAMAHGIDAANAHAYAREGQNAMVRDIERRIQAGSLSIEDFTNQPKV